MCAHVRESGHKPTDLDGDPQSRQESVRLLAMHRGMDLGSLDHLNRQVRRQGQIEVGRKADFAHARPGLLQPLGCGLNVVAHLGLAPIDVLANQAQPRRARGLGAGPIVVDRPIDRAIVQGIVAGHRSQQQRRVANLPGQHAHRIERPGVRKHVTAADPPEGWLQTDNAAVGSRSQDRATGLSAQGAGNHPGGDGRRRSAARASRCMSLVPGIARLGRVAVGELRRDGFPENDRPVFAQPADGSRVLVRNKVRE